MVLMRACKDVMEKAVVQTGCVKPCNDTALHQVSRALCYLLIC